jgi:hypothetical protein
MDIETTLITLAVAFVATIPALLQWRKYRSEANAADGDEADKISAAWERYNKTVITPLTERIVKLEKEAADKDVRISALEQTVINLTNGIEVLRNQIIEEFNGTPKYPPRK